MRLIRRRAVPRKRLELHVDVIAAKDVVIADAASCSMVAGVAFNSQRRRTRKSKRTANPVWNSSVRLRLSALDTSDAFHLAVFDKHRKYSIYLGEVRLSLIDLFQHDSKVEPRWYKLHSSKSQAKFVTGSVKLGFELLSKGNIPDLFVRWGSTLSTQRLHSIKLDEQFYYSDTDTDVDSMISDNDASDEAPKVPRMDRLTVSSPDVSDSSEVSDTSQINLSGRIPTSRGNTTTGVVLMDIQEASGLPPFRRFYQTSFDMDPFVVISFGKKTFRTSWRKHTLNPVFNQRVAFEVLASEQRFDIVFNVLDKDHISFHDKVAQGSIALGDILDGTEHNYNLPLALHKSDDEYKPHLQFKVIFKTYADLSRDLWEIVLSKYGTLWDIIQVEEFLEDSRIDEDFLTFFTDNDKTIEDTLTTEEMIRVLHGRDIKLSQCPICLKKRFTDIVTHVVICAQSDKLREFATSGHASKRWYSKALIKVAYGKYGLGKNNANILVQDRVTGFIQEEKMALYIRLGIRLLYKGKGADTKKMKNVLRNMSLKQGIKFDSPASVKDIETFIRFYKLDLSDCLEEKFSTFNEFFYRKLKPNSRPLESTDQRIAISPADCRCTAFNGIEDAQQVWIKGRSFTVKKLLGDAYSPQFEQCSVGVFRLAPQDYHRFHCPVDGVIGEPNWIQGEYYTVNPMAVRSHLDVFGENVRVVVPIDTQRFGKVMFVAVGAMMVGSTVLTVNSGDAVKRGDELGYFKFGGSTCLVLFQKSSMAFDSDLVLNSSECIETLVRVGMSIGHTPEIDELKRDKRNFQDEPEEEQVKIMRIITGGDAERSWEFYNLDVNSSEEIDDDEEEEEEE